MFYLTRNKVEIKQIPHGPKRIYGGYRAKNKDPDVEKLVSQRRGIDIFNSANQLNLAINHNGTSEKSYALKRTI